MEERRMSERREDTRWPPDDQQFSQCPKYLRHDLTEEQVVDLLNRGIQLYEDRQNIKFAKLTKKGILYLCSTALLGIYGWLVAHGFITLHPK